MSIFVKLAELANRLDSMGFYNEASEVDNILRGLNKIAYSDQAMLQHENNVRRIRKILGLSPEPAIFDEDVFRMFKQPHWSGIFVPNTDQKSSDILEKLLERKDEIGKQLAFTVESPDDSGVAATRDPNEPAIVGLPPEKY